MSINLCHNIHHSVMLIVSTHKLCMW